MYNTLNQLQKAPKYKWEMDINENISFSDHLLSLLGYTEEDKPSTFNSFLLRVHSEDVNYVRKEIERAIYEKLPYSIEYRFITLGGRELVLQDEGSLNLDSNGKVVGILGTINDISLRKKAYKAMWKTEYKLAVAHKIARLVSWEFIPKTRRIEWSEGIYELLGAEPKTVDNYYTYVHPHDLDFVKKTGTLSNNGAPYNIEYRLIKQDGSQIIVYEQAEVFYDANGNIERKIGTLQDITERKKTEEQLLNSEKLSVVGQLAAGVAHEIRNPLTSLRGFLQLLDGGMSNKEYYSIMLDELDRIEFIVSEFLNLAKPQAASFEYHCPIKLLKDVISLLYTEANLYNVTIHIEEQGDIPNLYCEKNQMKQVFINLIKNAMDAMPNGGAITIHAHVMPCNYLLIQFKDEGVGIPKERIKKIGEPFYSTKEKGTGLGIMICHKIIERHRGEISFDSKENEGTVVSISLPFNKS
jgi:two-component system, sporulation sensor kinase A